MVDSANSCGLCQILLGCLDSAKSSLKAKKDIELFRAGSMLMRKESELPILRICIGLGSTEAALADIDYGNEIQVGFPVLPDVECPIYFKLLHEMLRVCDKDHLCYSRSDDLLPTRVLDVGDNESSDSLRLYTTKDERGRYIALSHCWGGSQKFCTFGCNIDSRHENINFNELPQTFQDAVKVTRELGERFLWIDSICIIQPHEKCSGECRKRSDWDTESKKMEQVFGSAYCTIAATSAKDSTIGFLRPRSPTPCVRVAPDSPIYICKYIDNFQDDVEGGVLNQRGWVLQERALSRRTIHFTTTQTYWECGEGIQCESFTKILNREARMLGDAHFPEFLSSRGVQTRITLFQGLFEKYSKLDLSYSADRPVAISGLQSRVMRSFNTKGSYGIFQCYLHRSILWQRSTIPGDETKVKKRMERIENLPDSVDQMVPSWSWMAYKGGINYMNIPFDKVEWSNGVKYFGNRELQAPVREFLSCTIEPQSQSTECSIVAEGEKRGWLKFDREDMMDIEKLKCVVVGRAHKQQELEEKDHYILVVAQKFEGENYSYERVGVGSVQGRHISSQGRKLEARII